MFPLLGLIKRSKRVERVSPTAITQDALGLIHSRHIPVIDALITISIASGAKYKVWIDF